MKTIREHFYDLKPVHRELALACLPKMDWDECPDDLSCAGALEDGLLWADKPGKGYKYWEDIYNQLNGGTYHFTEQESLEAEAYRKAIKTLPEGYELLANDAAARKEIPIQSGALDYFPDAISAIAHCSWVGNQQHNKGQPLHWAREKSNDHLDCAQRHLKQRGTVDTDGVLHTTKAAWRILAYLQLEIEKETK